MEFINKLWSGLLVFLVIILFGENAKLNAPRILLPLFKSVSTSFLLEDMEHGCFRWSATRDVVNLKPLDMEFNCSDKVLISTSETSVGKAKTTIIGEDSEGVIVKCFVLLDTIAKLKIITTTKELFIDDAPEVITVVALDGEGNEFSSLSNVEFVWEFRFSSTQSIQYMPFRGSIYTGPQYIADLEAQDKKGNMILIQGVEVGSVTVTTWLPYMEYKYLEAAELHMNVSTNIIIIPSEVYMIPGDEVHFKFYKISRSDLVPVDLKQNYFFLKSQNPALLYVDKAKNEAVALKEGKSKVTIASMKGDVSKVKMPTVDVAIHQPAYMTLSIKPHDNWVILVGDKYDIIVTVYMQGEKVLHLGANTRVNLKIGDAFHIDKQSQNGTWITGWGITESMVKVTAEFSVVAHPSLGKFPLNHTLYAEAEMFIYPPIMLRPSEIILPWNPYSKPKFTVNFTATGGDGNFLWSTQDTSKGFVNQYGQVHTMRDGTFEVSAAMVRNHHNRKYARISILPPVKLEIAEYRFEAAVGEPIDIRIAMYALQSEQSSTYIPITLCGDLPYQIKLSNSNFRVNRSAPITLVGISCTNIVVYADDVGRCKVTVTMELAELLLEDSVIINAYRPLKRIQPEGEVVLAVGSTIHLLFEGGPLPLLEPKTTYQRVVVTDGFEDIVAVEDVTKNYNVEDGIVVWVLCKKLGQVVVHVLVSNTASLRNCKPEPAFGTTLIICGKPRSIQFSPMETNRALFYCPFENSQENLIIPIYQQNQMLVTIRDDKGRIFKNATSLLMKWTSNPPERIRFESNDGVWMRMIVQDNVKIANGSVQLLEGFESGSVTITAHIYGYNQTMLKRYGIVSESPAFVSIMDGLSSVPEIKNSFRVILMADIELSTYSISVFNQPGMERSIAVANGSGYINLTLSQNDRAEVTYDGDNKRISIIPLQSGDVIITVQDLCIISPPKNVSLKVITPGRIKLQVAEKVEINKCVEVVVTLYDELDQLMDIEDPKIIKVHYRLSKHVAYIALAPVTDAWSQGQIHYTLTGTEIGYTEVVFFFELTNNEVTSNVIYLQVFEPMRLHPRNVSLIIGSQQQLSISGGPYPDCNIEFNAVNKDMIIVSENGVIHGHSLGHTLIIAKAIGVHPRTGNKIVYAEDVVDVNIVKITNIKISAPITSFRRGTSIPVWVMAEPKEISPVVLGSFEDEAVQFEWSIEENGVATIIDTMSALGITYPSSDRVSARISGIAVGKTRLTVNVTLPSAAIGAFGDRLVNLIDYVDLEVIERFILHVPTGMHDNWFLMAPNSTLAIKTNYDSLPGVTVAYNFPSDIPCEKSAEFCAFDPFTDILTLSSDGVITSKGKVGFAIITITAIFENDGSRVTSSYVVKVKPVCYLMITVAAQWRSHLGYHLNAFPVGIEFILKARFYDSVGRRFNSVPDTVSLRGNRQDLLKLKVLHNNTIAVTILKAGVTIIKVWTDGLFKTADYIRVHSLNLIKSSVTYMVNGDILCLWSPITSRDFILNRWLSSDPDLAYIDPHYEVAYAVGMKEGTVYLSSLLHPSVRKEFHILPPARINILQVPIIITNGVVGSEFRIPVVISSIKCPKNKTQNLIQGWRCHVNFGRYHKVETPFKCFMNFSKNSFQISDLFKLKTGFTVHNGRYVCKLITKDFPNSIELATFDSNITIWVKHKANEHITSQLTNFTFYPNFYVESELHIPQGSTIGNLIIYGLKDVLQDLKIVPADPSIIYLDRPKLASDYLQYTVHVIDYHWKLANLATAMGIGITSSLTSQSTTVMVIMHDSDLITTSCLSNHQSTLQMFLMTYKHSLSIILFLIFIFIIVCYCYRRYLNRNRRTSVTTTRTRVPTYSSYETCLPPRRFASEISPDQYLDNWRFTRSEDFISGDSPSIDLLRRRRHH